MEVPKHIYFNANLPWSPFTWVTRKRVKHLIFPKMRKKSAEVLKDIQFLPQT